MTYDERADSIGSYYAAVEAKRLRGDTHWPSPDQQPRLNSSGLEGITSLSRLNPSIQCIDKSLGSPLASLSMSRPSIGHEDFCGSLQGVHIQGASSPYDADSGTEPSPTHGGAA